MILIVAPRNDAHASCVAQDLEARGCSFAFVDSARLTLDGRIAFRTGRQGGSTWTCVDGNPVQLETVETVWHRRRYRPLSPQLPSEADRNYFHREWTELLAGVFASLDAWFVNDPAYQEAAVKPLQLRMAETLGLRVPDTLITNDPLAAAAFVERHAEQVVHKTISPPRHRFLPTVRWSPADRASLKDLVLAPTIFQEIVTDCRELRITVIGDDVHAAEFRPRAGLIDGRLDVETPYLPHALPLEVTERILTLVRGLGLVFSTIDMKLTEDGEYVFLELNPQGQYLYIEILTGMPLTAAMASLLSGAARGTTRPVS